MSSQSITSIRSREVSHWTGVSLGVFVGGLAFANGMTSCFSTVTDTPRESFFALIGILSMLSVLPLALVAIIRPRFAGRWIAVAWLSYHIAVFGSMPSKEWLSYFLQGWADSLFWEFALPLTIVALLLRAAPAAAIPEVVPSEGVLPSQPSEAAHERAGPGAAVEREVVLDPASRKRMAKWIAIVLGVWIGLWRFQWAWHFALALRDRGWVMAAFGSAAPWLVAAPLAVLGLWKPRWAAYAFGACFLAILASPLLITHSLGGVFGNLPFTGVPALLFALVAALFFYASLPAATPRR
jgi:hypothetical protein